MRKILLLLALVCGFAALNAQNPPCTPDPLYKDSAVGVYPPPFDAVTAPKGGIDKPACLTRNYSFRFTVKVSDTAEVNTPLGRTRLPIDSITLETTGAVTNLPKGITYQCSPTNCSFRKNSTGCVVLVGVTDASNAIKDYSLVIKGKVHSPFLRQIGFPPYEVNFPGPDFKGEYILKVYGANDSRCNTASNQDLFDEVAALTNYPNPAQTATVINIYAIKSGNYQLSVFDATGRLVQATPLSIQAGENLWTLPTDQLANGLYIYSLSKDGKVMTNKFLVQR